MSQTILIEVLRLQEQQETVSRSGWLAALADRQLCAALTVMHQQPAHRWILAELSRQAGMSRSAFALRFKHKVGIAVMVYLTRWRMQLACDRLVNTSDPVATIASAVGYESESAFGFAFKREMGCAPREYARSARGQN